MLPLVRATLNVKFLKYKSYFNLLLWKVSAMLKFKDKWNDKDVEFGFIRETFSSLLSSIYNLLLACEVVKLLFLTIISFFCSYFLGSLLLFMHAKPLITVVLITSFPYALHVLNNYLSAAQTHIHYSRA